MTHEKTHAKNFDSCKNIFDPHNPHKNYDPHKKILNHVTHVKI